MADQFPPTEAAAALSEIEGYRETLTMRVFGLNLMVFALAIGAIPIAYAAATPWLADQPGGSVALALLWLPWIGGAVGLSVALWSTYSLTLDETQRPLLELLTGLGFTLLFFLLAGGLLAVGPEFGTYIQMSIAGGLLTALIGLFNHLRYGAQWVLGSMGAAAVVIVLAAIGIHTAGLVPAGEALATGFAQGTAYFVTGSILVYRG